MSLSPSETHACAPATTRGRGTLLGAHSGKGVVCYANGKQIVVRSLSDDSRTVFYDGHQYPTTVARVSPNGEWVASGDASGVVRVWGLNEDQTLKAEHRVLSGAVDDIQWSPDGERLVACGDGRGGAFARVFLWDSGSSVGDISGATKRVVSVAFRPKRPFKIAAASEDFTVSFFEGPPFAFAGAKHKHGNYANCVRFSEDGTLFASVGSDGFGVVYDGGTGAPLALCPPSKSQSRFSKNEDTTNDGHVGSVYACAWSPSGRVLLTVGADKTAKTWDASGVLRNPAPGDPPSAASAGDGARAIPGESLDALPRLAVTRTFRFANEPGVGDMQVGCAFLGEETCVALSLDGTLVVFDVVESHDDASAASETDRLSSGPCTNHSTRKIMGHAKPVVALGRLGSDGGVVSVSLAAVQTPNAPASAAVRWGFASDDAFEAFETKNKNKNARAEAIGLGHGAGAVVALASTRDGARLVSVGLDDTARVFFADSGTSVSVGVLPGQPRALAIAADGAAAAVACGDGDVVAFPCDGSSADLPPDAHAVVVSRDQKALCVSVSADGAFVFFGRADGAVRALRVSDAPDGRRSLLLEDDEGKSFTRHRAEIVRLACSPTRPSVVASADASRRIFVHDLGTTSGDPTPTHANHARLMFHAARITALAWSPDGKRLASGSLDGSVIAWDPWSSGAERITVKNAHPGGVTSLVWRDDARVCTGGFDACVRTWTV